jgi:DNA-binding NarL/FixJ family response regulator
VHEADDAALRQAWHRTIVTAAAPRDNRPVVTAAAELEHGRACYAERAWERAYEALAAADRSLPLSAEDLELLARAAYMLGRDDDYVGALERAQHEHLASGAVAAAVRCAFWIGHSMLFRGRAGPARGWFGRAERLLERVPGDCAAHGYVLIPRWIEQMRAGDWEAGHATAAAAAAIGERHGDADLTWLARDDQGRALVQLGRVADGMRLVDEVLVAATAGELSPIVEGIVYCNTIAFCRDAWELRQAGEWTDALTGWCARQPEMVAHNGLCLVHRAEIMQLRGDWEQALAEAERAAREFTGGVLNVLACGRAHYRVGEVRRVRGDLAGAEAAYQDARRHGFEPQPGLALLRLAQGDAGAAAAAIRRAVLETTGPLARAALLPAYVEIMLATGEREAAHAACRQLAEIAGRQGSEALAAMAAHAAGSLALASGDAATALVELRRACAGWLELGAPYEAARVRALLARACGALGDADTERLELAASAEVFERLGAASPGAPAGARTHGLSARELEVLRLVAAGMSNRAIATELTISEHTVARHLQNIFAKLGVSSRTAASAYAFEHRLT